MPLADTAIRSAKPRDKQYKMADERGLYVLVTKTGKYCRFDYRFLGKRKTLAIGVYPDVTLKSAREKRDEARRQLAEGMDPSQYKKEARAMLMDQTASSFEAVALEWFTKNKHTWTHGHSRTIIRRLELNVFPWPGKRPVASFTPRELLTVLRRNAKSRPKR